MKAKKIMVTVLAAAALVTGSVFGTMAYLTSNDSVTNTFTVGKVEIAMDEAKVTEYGEKDGDTRVTENTYKLIPGHTYIKDPTIHVSDESEECYLFVTIQNDIANIETTVSEDTVAWQMENVYGWEKIAENVFVAKGANKDYVVSGGQKMMVFDDFTIDGNVDNDTLATYEGKEIIVKGYAVQMDGFDTPKAAWDATFGAPTEG